MVKRLRTTMRIPNALIRYEDGERRDLLRQAMESIVDESQIELTKQTHEKMLLNWAEQRPAFNPDGLTWNVIEAPLDQVEFVYETFLPWREDDGETAPD
jgi:hypothetical protein